jgi:ribosomal protein S12 methylthiotransferase
MEIQSQISWDLNQLKLGQTFKCIIDRKEGGHVEEQSLTVLM